MGLTRTTASAELQLEEEMLLHEASSLVEANGPLVLWLDADVELDNALGC